jgi:alkyl sulfatase BDS1-like metallo-beta-lactamase superfamily hydrolase
MPAHPDLVAHSAEFRKDVIELAPGIWTAVGFAASNAHLVTGGGEALVIDTTESTAAAENILSEFRKLTDLPIRTILYTHSHRDHISGATVFAEGGTPEIIASHRFESDLVAVDETRPVPHRSLLLRTKRQFGMGLSFPDERVNLGLGPGDRPLRGLGEGYVPPTRQIGAEPVRLTLAGRSVELFHAPGETPDHLLAWLPDEGILFGGDNYYHSFPNLYAIRGTPYRDFDAWADSLDLMLAVGARILATGHSRPLIGAEVIRTRLTDYRDAIREIVAQCVDGMNAGLGWDEIAARVALPPDLAERPYLKEFYGKIAWAARAYCTGTLGWFDGNPTNLGRLAPRDEAARVVALAGGPEAVLAEAGRGLAAGEAQWAAELADRLLILDRSDARAARIKIAALRVLGDAEVNATARNTYLLFAQEMEAALG